MKRKFPKILFWSALLCLWTINVFSLTQELPEPQMNTDSDTGVGPPPPGLVVPIDSKIILLAAAGVILGAYVLRPKNV